jgi:predicted branched-subunit amino acid permease
VFLSTLFGATFDERLLAPAFLVIYAIIGLVIEEYRTEKWFIAVLIAAGFLASLHHSTARFPLPDRTWTLALSLGALAAVTAAAIVCRFRDRRRAEPPSP